MHPAKSNGRRSPCAGLGEPATTSAIKSGSPCVGPSAAKLKAKKPWGEKAVYDWGDEGAQLGDRVALQYADCSGCDSEDEDYDLEGLGQDDYDSGEVDSEGESSGSTDWPWAECTPQHFSWPGRPVGKELGQARVAPVAEPVEEAAASEVGARVEVQRLRTAADLSGRQGRIA